MEIRQARWQCRNRFSPIHSQFKSHGKYHSNCWKCGKLLVGLRGNQCLLDNSVNGNQKLWWIARVENCYWGRVGETANGRATRSLTSKCPTIRSRVGWQKSRMWPHESGKGSRLIAPQLAKGWVFSHETLCCIFQ